MAMARTTATDTAMDTATATAMAMMIAMAETKKSSTVMRTGMGGR